MAVTIETKEFWEQQVKEFKESGLSRSRYCHNHGINYDRFGYWIRKFDTSHTLDFVPVQVKPSIPNAENITLCTLELRGHIIKIHDLSALSHILDRIS